MKMPTCLVLVLCLLLSGPAQADPVIAIVTGDWNKDGLNDAAMILEPGGGEDYNSLKIYLGEEPGGRLRVKAHADNFVWGFSDIAGQLPWLEALPNGSLAVTSQNDSVGRNRWRKRLTIAWRDQRFVVAGFTYQELDTLGEPDADGNMKWDKCDLNLLAGKGDVNGKRVSFEPAASEVTVWNDDTGHALCGP